MVTMMSDITTVDVCIIGSGPAGMMAAIQCAEVGASVAVIDEQPRPGGQIYRAIREDGHPHGAIFGPDYLRGAGIVKQFESASIQYFSNATLWRIDEDKNVYWSENNLAHKLSAKRIIIATGATERPFPFPGWTLPGVMTAGSSQIMMKTAGLIPKQAVMVGTGPLLYLLAVQLIDAGSPPKAIIDTQQPDSYIKALKHAAHLWQGRKYLIKGLKLLAKIRKAGVKQYTRAKDIEALGTQSVSEITFKSGSVQHTIAAEMLLCHIGVIPNVQLTRAMGMKHQWDSIQLCWRPELDENGNSSIKGVAVAGDNGGIGGALVAEMQGQLCAYSAMNDLGYITDQEFTSKAEQLKQSIHSELAIRPFLDVLYTPPEQAFKPADKTIVCRCEEVTAKQIRDQIADNANGINQVKSYTRCGMGPCQGRFCGLTVAHIISNEMKQPMEKVGYYHLRNPIKPLTLGELASLTPVDQSFISKYQTKEVNNGSNTKAIYEPTHE